MASSDHALSPTFEWVAEYDALLEQIALTDVVDSEWTRLRDIIKYKIDKNVTTFLAEAKPLPPAPPRGAPREPKTPGGLWLPPFPPRTRDVLNQNEPPKAYLTQAEADDLKLAIYAQIHEFEGPPFTIQRVCELCLRPREHYTSVGKYLRAVEKSLLVTSAWDAFPPASPGASNGPTPMHGVSGAALTGRESTPATPLFSPIPFLHDDARRSTSRSPPPLALEPGSGAAPPIVVSEGGVPEPGHALGLVDELDDPRPGHMSDTPTALSSVTTLPEEGAKKTGEEKEGDQPKAGQSGVGRGKPLIASLSDRFVSSKTEASGAAEDTEMGSVEDKENSAENAEDKENQK